MPALTAAITFVDSDTGRNYQVRLVKEGATVDDFSKRFVAAPIGWRDGRLAFMFSDNEGDPHGEARHVGNLFNLRHETIDGASWVVSDLDWDTDDLALEAKRLVDEDRITGVSISPSDGEGFLVCGSPPDGSTLEDVKRMASEFDPETCPESDWVEAWGGLVIGSATLLINPAFEDARVVTADGAILISVGEAPDGRPQETGTWIQHPDGTHTKISDVTPAMMKAGEAAGNAFVEGFVPTVIGMTKEDMDSIRAVTAAADLKRPPSPWFLKPNLDGPTYVTVTDDGQVFGTLAGPDVCHRGFQDECVLPPKDAADFEEFHDNASVMTDDGKMLRVGCLTVDVGHADVRASSAAAKRHYDDSGTVVAFVRAGQDDNGIWVAGALAPWATEEMIEKLKRLRLSGDWRPTRDGRHFLIAAQTVPVPGFPIRAKVAGGFLASYTTLSPMPPQPDPLEDISDMALVASALMQQNALLQEALEWIREKREQERQADYEKALAILQDGASV